MPSIRERAIYVLAGLGVDPTEVIDDTWDQALTPDDAGNIVAVLRENGLRIVDADLFDALVQAVRARQWADECRTSVELEEFMAAANAAAYAQGRAIKALEES